MKRQYNIGEEVYLECYTSMGSSSEGNYPIDEIDHRYDEKSGDKYIIYKVGGDWYDGRNGGCYSNEKSMYGICLEDISHKLTPEDKKFLWDLMPEWVREVPEGLNPMMYGTLSHDGDKDINNIVKKLLDING